METCTFSCGSLQPDLLQEKRKGFELQSLCISRIKLNQLSFSLLAAQKVLGKSSNVKPLFLCTCQRQFQVMLVVENVYVFFIFFCESNNYSYFSSVNPF